MQISLSAVPRDSVVSFLKLLAVVYASYDTKLNKEQLRRLNMWVSESGEFLTKFKLTKAATAAVRLLVSGEDPNEDDATDAAISDFLIALKEKHPLFQKETDINRVQLGLMNDFRLAHFGSATAGRRLLKGVAAIGDPMVTQFFVHDFESLDHGSVYTKLAALVKKYGKVPGYVMPTEVLESWQEQAKAKGAKHPGHAEYLMLRREVNDIYKKALANIVRGANEKYLPLRDVMQQLKSMGVINNLPANFVGNIDDLGNFYTTAGKKLLQNPSGAVLMNPKYDPAEDNAYVCQFTPPFALKPTRAYTVEYRQGAKSEKFGVVLEVMPKLNALSKKWLPDLRLIDKKKEGVLATLCEFIFDTSARVGNKNAETDGERTFAATQLLAKHFKFAQNSCTVSYTGKSAGLQTHKVSFTSARGKQLGDALRKLWTGKAPNEAVFTFEDGAISGAMINRYLHTLGFPKKFTIHKLRTARGTKLAMDILNSSPFKKGDGTKETVVHKWLETELLKVGAELGHMSGEKVTSATAIQNYIAPELLAEFYAKLGMRPSAKVQKAIDSASKE